jgi:hypothetical protein
VILKSGKKGRLSLSPGEPGVKWGGCVPNGVDIE